MVTVMRVGPGALLVAALCTPGVAQVTSRVSLGTDGAQGNLGDPLDYRPSISADGRYVAFQSGADNFVLGDTNDFVDIFVRDRQSGTTERVSIDSNEVQADWHSRAPSISADGRYVAFQSFAANLVGGDTNAKWDVFVRDRLAGTTERVSVDSGGAEGNGDSLFPSISADGRYVAFHSFATDLVGGDANGSWDVLVRDRLAGTTERVSVDSGEVQANDECSTPSLSADGRYVAFASRATNLVGGDTNGAFDIFVRDRVAGTTERVSVDSVGTEGNDYCSWPSISADGRYVAFESIATNLVAGDTNGLFDVFVRDRLAGTTERRSVDSTGTEGNSSSGSSAISSDGRWVAFSSFATNLVDGDANRTYDVFVRDQIAGTTERVSVGPGGVEGDFDSIGPSITADGRYVAFTSDATNLVPVDTNGSSDIFLRDRYGGTTFTSLCDPGTGAVIPCPCGNPPSAPGRGCDNSIGTGGAILTAGGGTYLSSDSLVFTTSGEKPTALSIVSQWSGTSATGTVFGMGVRCTSGTLKRLYTKSASGGSITAPNFGAGDPQVSVRSAATGDTIGAGQNRWYVVYYRDPSVLGGCDAWRTFNATQTGQVAWSL